METKELKTEYFFVPNNELEEEDRQLVDAAIEAIDGAYAPYSHFKVGAAVRLADGTVVPGSNQENVAYPSGLCAERTALFAASAAHPGVPPIALAIAACNTEGHLTAKPVTPCGACRQVMAEIEQRYRQPLTLLLFGTEGTIILDTASDLLPLSFSF